jgi:hypothetical protein
MCGWGDAEEEQTDVLGKFSTAVYVQYQESYVRTVTVISKKRKRKGEKEEEEKEAVSSG